jgi:DNA-binding GntR family transcriptional regulator
VVYRGYFGLTAQLLWSRISPLTVRPAFPCGETFSLGLGSLSREPDAARAMPPKKAIRRVLLKPQTPPPVPVGSFLAPFPVNGTLSERVYHALKRDIIRGVFQPGEALTEKELARRYHGSRTPIREAAVRLQQDHLLRIVSNRGYFIRSITIQDLNQIYEFRAAVEGACAELAAQKNWAEEEFHRLLELARIEYRVDNRASYETFIESDTEFHLGIAHLARNPLLARGVADMRNQMERIMFAAIDIGYYGEMPTREHLAILEAIRSHDPQLARKRMCDHIFISKDKVLRLASGGNSRL